MKYLVMNAINRNESSRLSEPVGVLRLDYKTATAMSRLIEHTERKLDVIPNWDWKKESFIHLVSSEFNGPDILGITSVSEIKFTKNQRSQYERNRYVVINDKPTKITRASQSNLTITMYQQVFWQCVAMGRYEVIGPLTKKWERIAKVAINHLLTEAKKQPLSWENAWFLVRFSADYYSSDWYQMQERGEYDPEIITNAISEVLNPEKWYRKKLTPVEIAQLEVTQQHWAAE